MQLLSRLRKRPWWLALVWGLLAAGAAQAQSKIYWSVAQPYNQYEYWSMNPDGSGKAKVLPDGLAAPAPFDQISSVAGPSAGTYPLDPTDPSSPRARWWLAVVVSSSTRDTA